MGKRFLFVFLVVVMLFLPSLLGAAEGVIEEWVARYNGSGNGYDVANAIAVDRAGNIYVSGSSTGIGSSYDYTTIKYDTYGNQLWVARYNGTANRHDIVTAIAVDTSGNVYVTGYSDGIEAGYAYPLYEYATIKYDTNGNQLWVARYHGPTTDSHDCAYAIAVDASGNVYVTGETVNSAENTDYTTIKYDTNGNQLWVARYNGPGNYSDFARAIAVDNSGNVYVTGDSYGSSKTQLDYATIKYDSNGNQLWVARYDGPAHNVEYAAAIAIDSSDNVYVTGSSFGSGGNWDYATVKYDTNGNQLWVARYDGPGVTWNHDNATGIAVDNSGNVYVTGYSVGNGSTFDYATIKYDTNGNQLWVARYDGPSHSEDKAYAITIDVSGNVYVTGHHTVSGSYDYATIKYDTNGNQQWVASYQQDARNHATAITVDGLGNVYVTGVSATDYTTIKYSKKSTNHPPIVNAGPAQTVSCSGPNGAAVTLDGSGSSDPDGDTLTYTWTGIFGKAVGVRPTVQIPLGVYTITLKVDDGKGGTAQAAVTITVQDRVPPSTSATITGTSGNNNW